MNSFTRLNQTRKQIEIYLILIAKLKRALSQTEHQLYQLIKKEQRLVKVLESYRTIN